MKGTYLLLLRIHENTRVMIGALGNCNFKAGFYIYVGSAMASRGSNTLLNRVRRHMKETKNKKLHWHIDYLLASKHVCIIRLYLIPSKMKIECLIANELKQSADAYIINFGSSDCICKSHLFYYKNNPQLSTLLKK